MPQAADQAEVVRVGLAVLAVQLREAGSEIAAEHRLLEAVDS